MAERLEPLPGVCLAPSIAAAVDALSAARESVLSALSEAQSACQHRFVSEMPYHSYTYVGSRSAHRICNHCRLVEEGSHWSGGATWSKKDPGSAALGNIDERIVLPIDSDEFYKMRIAP